MSPVLPFDIIDLIVDIVGENKDTNLLKELALVSHTFLQICSKYLFATVELHDAEPMRHIASSKKGFIKLLKSRPDVVNHIRELTYIIEPIRFAPSIDDLLSPILPNFLQTISHLNYLKIDASTSNWIKLNSSLTSAFLHLMHLPTINHIELLSILNFPLSSLTPSVNLLRLDMSSVFPLEEPADASPEVIVQSEMMPKIREFHTSESSRLTKKLLHAKTQDGQPAFNFMALRRFSMHSTKTKFYDEWNIRYLLQNATLLEELNLSIDTDKSLLGLHDFYSPTLKVLGLTVSIYDRSDPLPHLCEELEATRMAGHGNMLEALSLRVSVNGPITEDFIGCIFQGVEKALVKPGWSALRRVSFEVLIGYYWGNSEKFSEALQSIPDRYFSQLIKLESVAFSYSVYVDKRRDMYY